MEARAMQSGMKPGDGRRCLYFYFYFIRASERVSEPVDQYKIRIYSRFAFFSVCPARRLISLSPALFPFPPPPLPFSPFFSPPLKGHAGWRYLPLSPG